ncbi:MAG: MTH1187 family thiamine-binding protein [Dehalococcoidales bacterium]
MVIAEISVVPVGTVTPSVSQYVVRAVGVLERRPELNYTLTGMGTIIEGELKDVMDACREMHESVFGEGVQRVVTTIRIDDRRDRNSSAEGKIQAVSKKMG